MKLGKEGGHRVPAADCVALALDEVEPLAVVNLGAFPAAVLEKSNGDPLQALATETAIEVVDSELGGRAELTAEILQTDFVYGGLLLDPLSKESEPLGLVALSLDPGSEDMRLLEKELPQVGGFVTHRRQSRGPLGQRMSANWVQCC